MQLYQNRREMNSSLKHRQTNKSILLFGVCQVISTILAQSFQYLADAVILYAARVISNIHRVFLTFADVSRNIIVFVQFFIMTYLRKLLFKEILVIIMNLCFAAKI